MNAQEAQLDYCLGTEVPAPGRVVEVAPGVRWLRMALPFQLDHINLWLLRDRIDGVDGWSIVDCGISNDATRAAWETIFANELQGLPVLRLLVTHMHPDHIGLAHWITERWNDGPRECRMWVSATDYHTARLASSSTAGFGGDATARFMASHGLTDPESLARIKGRTNYYANMVPQLPARYRRLQGGDTLQIGGRSWVCHAGYGHAPEHISLYCAFDEAPEAPSAPDPQGGVPGLGAARRPGVLISGDMVLPRISTNVSVIDVEPEADSLTLYLDSIERMRSIDPGVLVLPSHGLPFKGLHTRIDQLQAHHADRFVETLEACAEAPQSAFELVPVLFKRALDLHQMTFAMGESLAHLHALWFRGKLERSTGADGVIRFATV